MSPLKETEKHNYNIISNGNHWLDNDLPLDSDNSDEEEGESKHKGEKDPLMFIENEKSYDLKMVSEGSEVVGSKAEEDIPE